MYMNRMLIYFPKIHIKIKTTKTTFVLKIDFHFAWPEEYVIVMPTKRHCGNCSCQFSTDPNSIR